MAAAALAYRVANSVLGWALSLYFRRIEVRHRERLPARGPVLIAANHPAAFTDVLVLATRLPRRIHFLAKSGIFKPWIQGFALRLVGALPIYRREDHPGQTVRNDATFRACHEILDRGGAVLIFPEGTSETDRRLARMKTGAARLALAQEQRPGQQGRLTLLPAGLHFEDRTRFQSDVILSVGKPIDLTDFRMHAASDPRQAVVWLTAALQAALEELILHIPEPEVTALVHDLDRLYLDELKTRGDPRHELELARRVSECVEHFRRTDPERVYRVWRQVEFYRRKLEALSLDDAALRDLERHPRRMFASALRIVLAAIGLIPALAGGLIHVLPYRACTLIANRISPQPILVASSRIAAGLVILPSTYGLLALLLRAGAGWSPQRIALALATAVVLGIFGLLYFHWLGRERGRLRVALLAVNHGRMVARIRAERRELLAMFDQAREDFLAATGPGTAGAG